MSFRPEYRKALSTVLLMALCGWFSQSFADFPATPADFARLPRYCAARMLEHTVPQAERDRWAKRIGPDFLHIHHYCAALHSLRLANAATDERQREYYLRAVAGEVTYVEEHAQPGFFMRPELAVQKGRALLRLKNVPAAIKSFNDALRSNPKFPAAYTGIADAYLMLNQPAQAKAALERGVKAVPNSKVLRYRRAQLK